MVANDPNTQPRRKGLTVGGFFKALFKTTLFFLLVIGLTAGSLLLYRELDRSFGSVNKSIEIDSRRIDLLREELNGVMAAAPTQAAAVQSLTSSTDQMDRRLSELEGQYADDMTRQAALLSALQLQVAQLVTRTVVLTDGVATLNAGLLVLQGDLNENQATIDSLGGAVDGLEADVASLQDADEALAAAIIDPGAQLAQMQHLALFQVWELTSRARLHLLAGNNGLAAEDVALAEALVEALAATDLGANVTLTTLQQRLALVQSSLPGDPATAARDLEVAWDSLDQLLAALLTLPATPSPTPTETGETGAAATETPVPTPAGTPSP